EETAVGSAAAGRKLWPRAGLLLDRFDDEIVELPGRGEERLTRDTRPHLGARRLALGNLLDELHEVGALLEIVEADVELRRGAARNHVAGVGWGRDRSELEVRRWGLIGAIVEVKRIEGGDHPGEGRHRVGATLGISDMTLYSRHLDPHVDR